MIGATATSTSTLKNLVLPGIGHFTILDPNDVAVEDVGNNFFLAVESIGRPKAVETSRWLSELNDGVDSAAEVKVRRLRVPLWAKWLNVDVFGVLCGYLGHCGYSGEQPAVYRRVYARHCPQPPPTHP